jgi:hypothetical protein
MSQELDWALAKIEEYGSAKKALQAVLADPLLSHMEMNDLNRLLIVAYAEDNGWSIPYMQGEVSRETK